MKHFLLLLSVPCALFGQIPEYYQDIDFTQSQEQLKQDLSQLIINTHTYELEYTPEVWEVLKEADLDPNGNGEDVLLLYGYDDNDGLSKTDRTRDKDLSCHSSSCDGLWLREHVFPRSLADPDMTTNEPGTGTDAHNLRASDSEMNSYRSNYAFAEGSGNADALGYSQFYPGDEWKGDVARIIMYMELRYPGECEARSVGAGATTYHYDMPNIFLEWNAEDPVSQLEINRNNSIAQAQGNRNPFIDNPYLATMIWNGPDAENTWNLATIDMDSDVESIQIYPNPAQKTLNISSDISSVYFYNAEGKMVKQSEQETIKVDDLEQGIYKLLIVDQNGNKHQQTMIKK